MIGTFLNIIFAVIGVMLLVGGFCWVKDCIKKQKYDSSFCEGIGMLTFGIILTAAWISTMF